MTVGYAGKIGRLRNVDAVGAINTDDGRVSMLVTGEVVLPLGGTWTVQQSAYATLEQFRGDLRGGEGAGP